MDAHFEAADRDTLTGLRTRGQFLDAAAIALGNTVDAAAPRAMLLIDIDHFRRIVSSFGLAISDEVLRRVAGRIARIADAHSILGRVCGDEFVVLLPAGADAMAVATTILNVVARPFAAQGRVIALSASIGLSCWPSDGSTPEMLIRAAGIALEKLKEAGGNKLLAFEPAMLTDAQSRQDLALDMRSALALERTQLRSAVSIDQFTLFYQPQVATSDGRLTGFEALLRWRHPQRGLLGPDQFITLAENIGVIGMLGDWAVREACRAAMTWPKPAYGSPLSVAVNISPKQLADGHALIAGIARALRESGMDPARLHIEIVESALLGDVEPVLRGIKALGVCLSMDDFGSGFSSLGNLVRFPFDQIKMDRSFILSLDATGDAGRMIRAVASLGLNLGLIVVAEGIETLAQATLVGAAGVSTIQGYYFGRPVSCDVVADMILNFDDNVRNTA